MPPADEDGGSDGPGEPEGKPATGDAAGDPGSGSGGPDPGGDDRGDGTADRPGRDRDPFEWASEGPPDGKTTGDDRDADPGERRDVTAGGEKRDGGDPLDVRDEIGGLDGPGMGGPDDPGDGGGGPVAWFLRSDAAGATFLREFLGSVLVVLVVGMVLFAISGVWPPMVAVKSGSMEPEMQRGDLVFVMEEGRFAPAASVEGTGIATYRSATETGYRRFGSYGDVIIYRKDGRRATTPIIHRARFWVNEGENWYDRANESFVDGEDCEAVRNCPAPHAGFITKGDDNERYDQVSGISEPVKPEWVKGTAELRIPWLGHVRLELSELVVSPSPRTVVPPASKIIAAPDPEIVAG